MKRLAILRHEFVRYIPEQLEEGVIYVSTEFATVVHRCCCGCGQEVVTALSPTDWRLTYDGETISLDPSIGNWNFECRSHYFIARNRVKWASSWSREEIDRGRRFDRKRKDAQYGETFSAPEPQVQSNEPPPSKEKEKKPWQRWFSRRG